MCGISPALAFLYAFYFQCVYLSDIGRLKNAAALKKLILEEKIIPDLIDEAPLYAVTVQYRGRSFSFGNKVTVFDIVETPKVVNWPLKKGEKYTLIMTGLDVPTRQDPRYREYLHWLVVNIPDQNLRKGDHFGEYEGTVYDYQQGVHRVVYLVFQQNGTLHLKDDHHHTDFMKVKRENFSTRHFVNEYNLGAPFAINWAEVHESCDIVTPPDPAINDEEDEDGS
nr:PREDICTED: protein D2-like [Bemisia tabaci]